MIAGVLGLIYIIMGVITKERLLQDIFYIAGGLFLLIYAVDLVFIILEIIFTLTAVWDGIKERRKYLAKIEERKRLYWKLMKEKENALY